MGILTLLLIFAVGVLPVHAADALPGDPVGQHTQIRLHAGRGEFDRAKKLCLGLLQAQPHHYELYETVVELAVYDRSTGQTDDYLHARFLAAEHPAPALFGRGCIALQRRDYARAIAFFERSLELGGDSLAVYAQLENALEKARGLEEAIRWFSAECHRSPGNAGAWYALALAYWSQERPAKVLETIGEAIRLRPRAHRLEQLRAAADCYHRPGGGRVRDVRRLFEDARAREDLDGAGFLSWALVNARLTLSRTGEHHPDIADALADVSRLGQYSWRGHICLALAGESLARGDAVTSGTYADSALAAFSVADDIEGINASHEMAVSSLLEAGEYTHALDRLLNDLHGAPGTDRGRVATEILLCLAQSFLDLGALSPALAYAASAEHLLRHLPDAQLDKVRLKTILGLIHRAQGNRLVARKYLQEALVDARRNGMAGLVTAACEGNLGLVLLDAGETDPARKAFETQLSLARTHHAQREEASALANLGMWHAQNGSVRQARSLLTKAREASHGDRNKAAALGCLRGLAMVEASAGARVAEVEHWYRFLDETSSLYRHRLLITLADESYESIKRSTGAARQALCAAGHTAFAFDAMETARWILSSDFALRYFAPRNTDSGDSLFAAFRQVYAQLRRDAALVARDFSLADADDHWKRLGAYVRIGLELERQRLHQACAPERPHGLLHRLQRETLGSGEALLVFAVDTHTTASLFVTKDTLLDCASNVRIDTLRSLIGGFVNGESARWCTRQPRHRQEGDVRSTGRRLSSLLLAPYVRALSSVSLLKIVPDGPLWSLPFEALEGADGAALLRSTAVTYLPGVAGAVQAGSRTSSRRSNRVAVFADPCPPWADGEGGERIVSSATYEGRLDSLWGALPHARSEADRIREILSGHAEVRCGAGATEHEFVRLAAESDRIHVASHAVVDPRNGDRFLQLSPGGGEDGKLHADEILALPFRSGDVVLAGCSTAGGESAGTGGGLARAFFAAGAGSVVASRSDVLDRATARLIEQFYLHVRTGKSNPEALRHATLDLLNSGSGDPQEWAAYMIMGGEMSDAGAAAEAGSTEHGGSAFVLVVLAGSVLLRWGLFLWTDWSNVRRTEGRRGRR